MEENEDNKKSTEEEGPEEQEAEKITVGKKNEGQEISDKPEEEKKEEIKEAPELKVTPETPILVNPIEIDEKEKVRVPIGPPQKLVPKKSPGELKKEEPEDEPKKLVVEKAQEKVILEEPKDKPEKTVAKKPVEEAKKEEPKVRIEKSEPEKSIEERKIKEKEVVPEKKSEKPKATKEREEEIKKVKKEEKKEKEEVLEGKKKLPEEKEVKKERVKEKPQKTEHQDEILEEILNRVPPLIFGKYDLREVKVGDPGLARYINLTPVGIPHTGAKHANRWFGKTKVNIVERLINNMMRTEHTSGKKAFAYRTVRKSFEIIEKRTKQNPIQILVFALENSSPKEEITRLRFGGISVPKAVDTSTSRKLDVAIRNICKGAVSASHRNKKRMEVCLAEEIILASKADMNSFAVSKKEELERIAASAR